MIPTDTHAGNPATDLVLLRIANSLEQISGDLDRLTSLLIDDRRRTRERLASIAQRLVDDAHAADESFAVADERMARSTTYPREREVIGQLVTRLEEEAMAAWARLRRFSERHPDVTMPEEPSWKSAAMLEPLASIGKDQRRRQM